MTLSLADPPEHAIGLPATSWQVWWDALPQAAGFAVDLLERFAAPWNRWRPHDDE